MDTTVRNLLKSVTASSSDYNAAEDRQDEKTTLAFGLLDDLYAAVTHATDAERLSITSARHKDVNTAEAAMASYNEMATDIRSILRHLDELFGEES